MYGFTPKPKEPLLSEQMQNSLLRSMKEIPPGSVGDGYDLMDVYRYKFKIMNDLLQDQDLLHTLHLEGHSTQEHLDGEAFRDTCIFDYMKLPDLKDRVKNYICFDVFLRKGSAESITTEIIIRTVSHQSDMKTDWNIGRHDLLAEIISARMDWTDSFGKTLHKISDGGYTTNDGYCYRELTYRAVNLCNPGRKLANTHV